MPHKYKLYKLITVFFIMALSTNSYSMPDVSKALSEIEFHQSGNKKIKLNSFADKTMVLFFGYTNCPDICPTTLLDSSRSLKALQTDANKIQAVFISVDYQRDTPDFLEKYVNYFDKRIIGVTSSKKNIDRINKAFNTKYALLDTKSENYLVEHSSNVYIIDKDMIVQRIIANGLPSDEITKAIKKLID